MKEMPRNVAAARADYDMEIGGRNMMEEKHVQGCNSYSTRTQGMGWTEQYASC